MIPKLEFTAESWNEEDREEVTKILDRQFILNGNEDILCHPDNANCWLYAYKGYENHKAELIDYGYASTEAAIEKFLQIYKDDSNTEYFIELGLMSMKNESYYKNGTYINENGEDTGDDYWNIEFDEEPKQDYEGCWVTFSVFKLIKRN